MKRNIIAVLIMLNAGLLFSQQIPFFSQYYINPLVYNPSLTGTSEDVRMFLIHKSQWKDMPGAPVTTAFSIDGPIEQKKIGLGFGMYRDAIDITDKLGIYSAYSYRIDIDNDNKVLLGLSFGVIDNRIDFSNVKALDANDPALFGQQQRKISLDASLGAAYMWKTLEVGLMAPQLFGNSLKYDNDKTKAYYNLERHYIFSAKYVFDVMKEKNITAYPHTLVRFVPGAPVQFDVNAVLDWKEMGWFAASYKHGYAVGLNLGVRLKKSLSLGYAYDLVIGPIGNYSGAGHEILLNYNLGRVPKEDPILKAAEKQALEDRLANLQSENSGNKTEIDKLKSDIERLKQKNDSIMKARAAVAAAPPAPPVKTDSLRNDVRLGDRNDFKDEKGVSPVEPGFYVVVGSFLNKELADKAKIKYSILFDADCKLMFKESTRINYVYASRLDTYEQAADMLKKVRPDSPDSWVMEMKK